MKSHRTHSETEVFPTLSSHNEVMPEQFCQQFANTCCSTNKGGFLKWGIPKTMGFHGFHTKMVYFDLFWMIWGYPHFRIF